MSEAEMTGKIKEKKHCGNGPVFVRCKKKESEEKKNK
jgi:hypothetical protein